MTISFPEEDAWIAAALEARKRRVGAPYSATIRIALERFLAEEASKSVDELRSFSKVAAPATRRSLVSS